MRKLFLILFILLTCHLTMMAQTGSEFWFAPPEVTFDHNSPGGVPIYLMLTCMDQDATVTISQPANAGFNGGAPIVVNLLANTSSRVDLTSHVADLETLPTDAILNTGLLVESTNSISAYYEVSNTNNCDIFALKGPNGLGTEFYIPLQNYSGFNNHTFATNPAYASFDIVATEDNTTIMIYARHDVDGHAALTPFTITLNRGQTYSCAWTGANYTDPATHPTGAVVLSDKPVAITIKDDSCHNPSGGCYDLMGDQVVPVGILGTDYIAVKGSLNEPNGDESVFITGVQNNTKVYIDGGATEITTLFAGQTYRIDVDNPTLYVQTSKPVYLTHVTGFGCEEGVAVLPPLNCAGSEQISFVRSTAEGFFLSLLVQNGSEGNFTLTGPGTATINAGDFSIVPGTSNEWVAAIIQFNTTEIPVDQTFMITNSTDVFCMGIINGGGSTGCRYGYFSEFVATIYADAGTNQTVCANDTVNLTGSIGGGVTTGIWTTNGTGSFEPDPTDLSANYIPSLTDVTGSIRFWLTSTGICNPVSDSIDVTFTPAPDVNAGNDTLVGSNNPNVQLNGSVTVATGGIWSGGNGTYSPDELALDAIYTPSAAEISAGTVTLTLTSTGNGICHQETDLINITIEPGPTVNAGTNQTVCANNSDVTLVGAVTNATGGVWSGGNGIYNPNNAALNIIYTPTAAEISSGSVYLILETTGNGANLPEDDTVWINFTLAPIVSAGSDITSCANNPDATLNGTSSTTSGQWIGGFGSFNPDRFDLAATYTPTATEIASGSVNLILESTGNGTCNAEQSNMNIIFTLAPVVDANTDQSVCSNNAAVTLDGSVTTGSVQGIWSGGLGSFNPVNTNLAAVYTPTAAEISAGSLTLTLSSTNNGNCIAETDNMTINFTPAPVVSPGPDKTVCGNNADVVLNGSVTIASGGTWSGGGGIFNPNENALNAIYTPSAAEIAAAATVNLILTSTGNGNCNAESNLLNINITPAPIVSVGANQILCENNPVVTLNGSVTGAAGGQWSGGLGLFNPGATTLNANYTPTAGEMSSGSLNIVLTSTGNGDCNAETATMNVIYTNAPIVNAGLDQTVGGNSPDAALNGSITIASGSVWSGGTGTYDPNATDLNAMYTPSATEITAGSVTLYLTTTGNGDCIAVTDSMLITIDPAPIVDAGSAISACVNNSTVTLNGSITNATGGVWSNGSGSFIPGNTDLNATYVPTAGEISAGSVTLTLTSTGNGTNNPVNDQVVITFNPAPSANANTDQSVCDNNADISLAGSVNLATGGQWTGGLGIFTPNATSLNAVYSPTATEINSGSLDLFLTTTGNGACNADIDTMTVLFTSAPTVDAGSNLTVCANNSDVSLSGSVTLATGGIWTGGLGSFNPGNTSTTSVYTPHINELNAGSVQLNLTSTGNGGCNAVSDSLIITFTPSPIVNAGIDLSACENNSTVSLNGAVNGATGGVWSNGNGTFNPDNSTLNATYTPTAGEIANGSVNLILTSTGNGTCNPETNDLTIAYTGAPFVYAGNDETVCGNNSTVTLNGNVTGATGGQWSGGSGAYSPGSTTLNAVYQPSASEIATGNLTLTLTSTGNGNCSAETNTMNIFFTQTPTVEAGANQTVCANNPDVALQATYTVATGGYWNGGLGTYNPDNTSATTIYTPSASEISTGSVKLFFTTTGNGSCNPVTDSLFVTITQEPTVFAGTDHSACENNASVILSGSLSGATGGQWTGGSGVFNPGNTTLNATYSPTPGEISTGSLILTLTTIGNGNCIAESDDVEIVFNPAPSAMAGPDQTICENNPNIQLAGSVSMASGGTWSAGLGLFTPDNNTLNAVYTPTAGELLAGSVTLTLTTTGNGSCNAESDDMTVLFTSSPTVDAGNDQTICANNPDLNLNGIVNIATGGLWSGGTGSYIPGPTNLNTVYTPSATEIAAGSFSLTLSSTGNGNCLPTSDNILITVLPSPIVDAGSDISACSNNATVNLNGIIQNAGGGIWTGGTGVYNPGSSSLNATYTPTPSEISAGSILMTLSSTGNGSCNTVSDQVTITFSDSPTANAGADQSLCANNPGVSLNGSVTLASGGIWSGGLGIFNPDNSSLNTTYTPAAAELSAGSVSLTLSTTGNGSCNATTDNITILFTTSPTVNAGSDQTLCANNADVFLGGNVTISGGGIWSSSGTGIFTPSNIDLNATYLPSNDDVIAGNLNLSLTTTNNGNCLAVSDVMNVSITSSPIVNAGTDQTVCPDNLNISLNGSVSGGTSTGIWSTSGNGSFIPNAMTLNATYKASSLDSINQGATLTLTSTNNGNCTAVSDIMEVFIYPAGNASAGPDTTVCANNANVYLTGTVSGGATAGIWQTSGTGTFSPSNTNLYTTYIPSTFDTSNGTVTLTLQANSCNLAEDDIIITYYDAPNVNAGVDGEVCVNNPLFTLNGMVSGATGGIWSGGNGTFTPDNITLNGSYSPSSGEIAAGFFELVLISTGNGDCSAVTDSIYVTINPPPLVNAGSDVSVCANNAEISLNGNVTGGTITGIWSTSGSGSFSPDATTLNAIYVSSASDVTAGSVTLTLTSTNNGGCIAESDNINISYTPAPTANAGPDVSACANNVYVQLSGAVTIVSGGIWSSSGTGEFVPGNTSMNATYIPSTQDTANGNLTITLTTTGNGNCIAVSDEMGITMTPAPYVEAGSNQITCVDDLEVSLYGSISGATTSGIWTTSGSGIFLPNNTSIIANYQASSADSISGSVMLHLSSTNNGNCLMVSDSLQLSISAAGIANAGMDQTLCANNSTVSLNGTVMGGATTGQWTSSGSGNFVPDNSTLNAEYFPSTLDTSIGNVTLTLATTNSCNAASDDITIVFTTAPNVFAGPDQTVCGNNAGTTLAGAISIATGGIWTTSGTGSFVPNSTSLGAVYIPGNNDITNGSVVISLASTGNGNCLEVSDNMMINITPAPVIYTGPDQTVCEGSSMTQLMGFVSGSTTTGIWTTNGTGTFIPNNEVLNSFYEFSPGDMAAGSVDLILSSTNNGICNTEVGTMTITFGQSPFVFAGVDQTICAENLSADLNGIISGGTTTGQWSTMGSGAFLPDNNSLNSTYYFSQSDSIAGFVRLILTSTNNGSCSPGKDTITINIENIPMVNAGIDHTICEIDSVQFSASITNAPGGIWSSSGSGSFANIYDLNTWYYPDIVDIMNGSVTFYLVSNGSVSCSDMVDSITVTIIPAGTVQAGPDQTVCANNPEVTLSGTIINGASEGIWTSSGTGTFANGSTNLDNTYIPSSSDTSNSSIIIYLTATNSCGYVYDSLTIGFTANPTANAGPDKTICGNNASVNISGSIGLATGGIWSTSGDGTFIPNNYSLNTVYQPGTNEIANGGTYLYLTTIGNGNCNSVTDLLSITITDPPIVNSGFDQEVCNTSTFTQLSGSVSGGSTTGQWFSLGTGTFQPDITTMDATYAYSAADVSSGSVSLVLFSTNNGLCNAESDTMTITFGSTVYVWAGSDQYVCEDNMQATLNGIVSGGSSTGQWISTGTGTFLPNGTTLNAGYIFDVLDSLNGYAELILTSTNNGGCLPGTDTVMIYLEPMPQVYAGTNLTLCAEDVSVQLSPTVSNVSGIKWTSIGNGSFEPNDSTLNATYVFGSQDYYDGTVDLILSSTGDEACSSVEDVVTISIIPEGVVNVGPDLLVCANNSSIQLNGIITGGASQGIWTSSGNGNFNPDAATSDAVYVPSDLDIEGDSIYLIYTATNSCNFAADTINIEFTPTPVVNAGEDQTVCANNPILSFVGSFDISTGAQWSTTGDGTFQPGGTSMNTYYSPGVNEIENGFAEILLTTIGNGNCLAETDDLFVTITEAPLVEAGPDQSVCTASGSTILMGSVTGGSSTGQWVVTIGSGTLFDENDLVTEYTYSANDLSAGYVSLTLVSTNNGNCLSESDQMSISFGSEPFVYAGEDQTICSDSDVQLNGAVSGGASTGEWSTSGTGIFIPDNQNLSTSYQPSSADSIYGVVQLILSSTNNGSCNVGSDTMLVTFEPVTGVNAGEDYFICAGTDTVQLSGAVSNALGGAWSTNGTGSFVPDNTSLDAIYVLSQSDSIAGEVIIVLTSTGNGNCTAVSDTSIIMAIDPLIPDFTNSPACIGNVVNFTDNTAIVQGYVSSWEWDFGGGNISNSQNTTFSFGAIGNFDVSLMVSSSLGCSFSTTKTIYAGPYPDADFSYGSTCWLDSVGFTDASTISAGLITDWQWLFGDMDTAFVQHPNHMYGYSGTFNVLFTATSDNGCASSVIKPVTIHGEPTADFEYEFDCQTNAVNFTDASSSEGQLNSWQWDFGDGNTGITQNPQHEYDTIDTYTVQLISGYSAICSDTVQNEVVAGRIVDFSSGLGCAGQNISFTDQTQYASGDVVYWVWNFGDNTTSQDQNPYHIYDAAGSYDVVLNFSTDEGCNQSITKPVTVYPVPTAEFDIDGDDFLVGGTIIFNDNSTNAISWIWDYGDGSEVSLDQLAEHIYNYPGNFGVDLVATNEYSCNDTVRHMITIFEDIIYPPKMPTGFSPNGDGENDVFLIRGGPFSSVEFMVYNKWGERIFYSTDAASGWDGTKKGKDQPVGVYVYILEAVTIDGEKYSKTGDVTLIR